MARAQLAVRRGVQIVTAARMDVTCLILTKNEELHLDRCLERVAPFVARTVIIDSFSTDRTLDIARAHGAEILQHPFSNHAAQFNWGMGQAKIGTAWTLRLDADEYLDTHALEAMRQVVETAAPDVGAVAFRRGVVFRGVRIAHGGIGEVMLTRLWRTGQARLEARWMDEHVEVTSGCTIDEPRGAIIDETRKDLHWFTAKHNDYATRQMVQHLLAERGEGGAADAHLNAHAAAKRALRERLYIPAPLHVRALLYFLWRYFLKRGWRDGREGLPYHGLQGLWNFMLVDLKLAEARRTIAETGWDGFRRSLKLRHGIALAADNDGPDPYASAAELDDGSEHSPCDWRV